MTSETMDQRLTEVSTVTIDAESRARAIKAWSECINPKKEKKEITIEILGDTTSQGAYMSAVVRYVPTGTFVPDSVVLKDVSIQGAALVGGVHWKKGAKLRPFTGLVQDIERKGGQAIVIIITINDVPFSVQLPEATGGERTHTMPGMLPLLLAAESGDLQTVKALIPGENAHLSTSSVVDSEGNTALHRAAEHNHYEVVGYLLSKGADPNGKNRHGNSPYSIAVGKVGADSKSAQLLRAAGGR
jgi:hypothetical protein